MLHALDLGPQRRQACGGAAATRFPLLLMRPGMEANTSSPTPSHAPLPPPLLCVVPCVLLAPCIPSCLQSPWASLIRCPCPPTPPHIPPTLHRVKSAHTPRQLAVLALELESSLRKSVQVGAAAGGRVCGCVEGACAAGGLAARIQAGVTPTADHSITDALSTMYGLCHALAGAVARVGSHQEAPAGEECAAT